VLTFGSLRVIFLFPLICSGARRNSRHRLDKCAYRRPCLHLLEWSFHRRFERTFSEEALRKASENIPIPDAVLRYTRNKQQDLQSVIPKGS
jgi:hypothetical protein